MSRSRTNIELDDHDVATIMNRYGLRTKTEAVALALRRLAGDPMSLGAALALSGTHSNDADLRNLAGVVGLSIDPGSGAG